MVLAEKELIGSLILYPEKTIDVIDLVRPEDFVDNMARAAFITIVNLWKDKKHVSLSSVAFSDKTLVGYISKATECASKPGIVETARNISLAAKEHRINSSLEKIRAGGSVNNKLGEILSLYQKEMFVTSKDPSIIKVLERVEERIRKNKISGSVGTKTGFGFLEEKYIKYIPGHIWVIGGFTSTGKTATAVQKIVNILNKGDEKIVFISTEMTEEQLVSRIISNITGIHSYRVLSGNYRSHEEEAVDECKKFLKKKRLSIYDDIYTLNDIETVFRREELQGGVDIGFIDYIQNCQVPEAKSEYQEQSTLAKRIQKLGKDIRATIICMSQVSNEVGRGKTEQLEFKGAGEWAAVTDIGIMLQRSKKDGYKLKYMVKKNRHGALCESILEYKLDYTRLQEC